MSVFATVMDENISSDLNGCDNDSNGCDNSMQNNKIYSQRSTNDTSAKSTINESQSFYFADSKINLIRKGNSDRKPRMNRKRSQKRPLVSLDKSIVLERARKLQNVDLKKVSSKMKNGLPLRGSNFDSSVKKSKVRKSKSIVGTRPLHWNSSTSRHVPPKLQRSMLSQASKVKSIVVKNSVPSLSRQNQSPPTSCLSQNEKYSQNWSEKIDVRSMNFKLPFHRKSSNRTDEQLTYDDTKVCEQLLIT